MSVFRFDPIERFELIDHTRGAVSHYPHQPRTLIAKGVTVEFSIQDGGGTLKIFLTRDSCRTPTQQIEDDLDDMRKP